MQPDQPLPPLARLLGLAGLLPFLAAGAVAAFSDAWPRQVAIAALAAHGAVILSFLGAVHWGFALAAPDPAAQAPRLVGGMLCAAWAVAALAMLPPGLGCLALAVGLTLALGAEEVARARGWTPAAYHRLRRLVSLVGGACLLVGFVVAGG